MKVPSEDIPQADYLIDVIRTVIAVSQGARTFQQIATSINKVERQGRYYRKAAEIIGMIATPNLNESIVTALGHEFLRSNPVITNPILLQGVFNSRIFQRIIPFLEINRNNGVSRNELEAFLSNTADLGAKTMAHRRISTVISWLTDLGVIQYSNSRYVLSASVVNQRIDKIEFNNFDEPLLPNANNLNEYTIVQQRATAANESIITYRNSANIDRADNAHRHLVNLTSERIRQAGVIPKYNQFIDLAAHINNTDFIFEMKSTTEANEKSQIRAGLSQLYEYRYLQNKPQAKLVLIIEKPLSRNERWRQEYLEQDREIHLIWDGDNTLYGSERSNIELPFLNLQL
ncbi:MAG: hypothetical protein CMI36_05315 [Owenweeksia sp.]|nr:hypothetical protein [Owenweeksia sp.]MBF98389.1 hypothetical protein [Owenweeksia sp.]|tara:strand:- start:674 stop:1708 length:1035 start_codon:yes stop_codon:yes gene_type:complete